MTISRNLSEQIKFNDFLIRSIKKSAFASGSQLAELLVSEFSVTSEYARKIVQRAATAKILKSSKPYTFGKGQYIYVLPDNELEYDQVMDICKKSKPPIYRLMATIKDNNGIISKYDAIKITGAPKGKSSTKVETVDDMIKLLSRMEFVYEQKDQHDVSYVIRKQDFERLPDQDEKSLMQSCYNRMVMDCSLIPDVLRWMSSINLIDTKTNVPIYRNKKVPAIGASHNNILWDAYCYTKTTGINDVLGAIATTADKQTMVAFDIVLSNEYTDLMLDGFVSRIQINRHSVKGSKRKIFPIVVYNDASEFVLNKIRKLGILAIDIGSIFGARIYSVIQRLDEINNKLLSNSTNVELAVEGILQDIRDAGQEEALKDLKGVLFETLMYPLIKNLFPDAMIERGRTLKLQLPNGSSEYYEYDYLVYSNRPKELIIIELKGYNSSAAIPVGDSNTKSTLSWFFRRTLPFAGKFFKDRIAEGLVLKGVYMTTANFWKEAKEYIGTMNKGKLKPKSLSTGYDRKDLITLLSERGFDKEVQIIDKFYTKEEEHE